MTWLLDENHELIRKIPAGLEVGICLELDEDGTLLLTGHGHEAQHLTVLGNDSDAECILAALQLAMLAGWDARGRAT